MTTKSENKNNVHYPCGFIPKLDLGWAATSRYLRQHPIHRWFSFRHSFSPELVEAVLNDWKLPKSSTLYDPFVGAGTTILTAKQNGFSCLGIDLSPLAILSSEAKVTDYNIEDLKQQFIEVKLIYSNLEDVNNFQEWISSSDRLLKAFSTGELKELLCIRDSILKLCSPYQSFFLLALLAIIPKYSRAVSDGGWFRWVIRDDQTRYIFEAFCQQVSTMISDLEEQKVIGQDSGPWKVILGDARSTNCVANHSIGGVITSPPYPNRHDYSRVFQMELLLLGNSEKDITNLRHSSLRSHVEANNPINFANILKNYFPPDILNGCLLTLGNDVDKRIPKMIKGYFEDIYLTLYSIRELVKPGANVAFVVGNVRHCGVLIPVDEIIVSIGEQLRFSHYQSWVVRLRGNSAQQMGKYGREPSRETVVMLQIPK